MPIRTLILLLLMPLASLSQASGAASPSPIRFWVKSTDGGSIRVEPTTIDRIGRSWVVVFGFTHCAGVCPMTLQKLKRVTEKLSPDELKSIQVLFVTVDPERDTSAVLKAYLKRQGVAFKGGFVKQTQLEGILRQLGAHAEKIATDDGDIAFDHSVSIYFIDSRGFLTHEINPASNDDTVLKDLRVAIDEAARVATAQFAEPPRPREIPEVIGTSACRLEKGPCRYVRDGKFYELSLSPRPLKILKPMAIDVTTDDSKLRPIAVAFEGVNFRMSFLRPELRAEGDGHFHGEVTVPACSVKKMEWKIRLLLRDELGKTKAVDFSAASS